MDLRSFEAKKASTLKVLDPVTNLPTDIEIDLVSMDSPEYQQAKLKAANRRIERAAKLGARYRFTAEEMEQENLEMLARCTVDWRGLEEQGQGVPFSREAAVRIYGSYPFIREQVEAHVRDRSNFFGS